ncbi:hypothetical protein Agabi119p4_4852 [Agaricus bisporus var. burnettii]|uniref:Uncharacterized protein n=1 Tax=Agaricus bisporus var. burnettii TaxID=192524 RepID=A0A8H7KHA9_AGABI|nr:hypothetical protein Agabi119p4_4852 [Agaricus bisporus var. burnettii]
MARQVPRIHRLPQRLDYTLVPAPLDLSLPTLTEKSPLPAIIVTPSSPSHTHDFSIAFLAPPPKLPFRKRFASSFNNTFTEKSWLTQPRPLRTFFILSILFFILTTTYLINHRVAGYPYPRLDLDIAHRELDSDVNLGPVPDGEFKPAAWDWVEFGFRKVWESGGNVAIGDTVDGFIS